MALVTQLQAIERANMIRNAAERSLAQFSNSFDAVLADLAAFEADRPTFGFDAATNAEIDAIRDQTIQNAATEIQTRLDQLAARSGG